MTLNEFKDELKSVIAPTDSRFRSDVRQLELGNLGNFIVFFFSCLNRYYFFKERATEEKTKLEEKQRESRNNRKGEFVPNWFQLKKHPFTSEETYFFNFKYWQRDFKNCPDLYIKE